MLTIRVTKDEHGWYVATLNASYPVTCREPTLAKAVNGVNRELKLLRECEPETYRKVVGENG